MTPKNFNFQKTFYLKNYFYFNDLKNAPNLFGCWKVKYLWPILCLYFWGPEAMRGNKFKEKKVVPLIFTQFWIRSHLNQIDRLTPQDVTTFQDRKTNLFVQIFKITKLLGQLCFRACLFGKSNLCECSKPYGLLL